MASVGNTSINSLLASARAARNRQRSYEDAVAAFDWQNSTQTYDDFLAYSQYLDQRIQTAADAREQLAYMTTKRTVNRTFTSAEIQRQSIDVLTGRGTNTDKYNAMLALYNRAVNLGDFNNAQNLEQQLYNLQITLQNEQEAAQRAANTAALNGVKSAEEMVDAFEGDGEVVFPDGTTLKGIGALNKELRETGTTESGYFEELYANVVSILDFLEDSAAGAATLEAQEEFVEMYNDIYDGIDTAAGKMNFEELQFARDEANANNSLYSVEVTDVGTDGKPIHELKKNKTDEFLWARRDDGSVYLKKVQTAKIDPQQALSTRIDDQGRPISATSGTVTRLDSEGNIINVEEEFDSDSSQSIENRLRRAGVEITGTGSDGTIGLILPDGQRVRAVISEFAGSYAIRYVGQPNEQTGEFAGLYEIDLITGQPRVVGTDEISDFGDEFSAPSDVGRRLMTQLQGVYQPTNSLSKADIQFIDPDLTGRSVPVFGQSLQGSVNGIMTNAARIQLEQQRRAEENRAAQRIQQSTAPFSLNQTPVRSLPRASQIQVRPTPEPQSISVQPIQEQRRVRVTDIPTQPKVRVGSIAPQPKVVVR